MGKHSKNNNERPFFTHAERRAAAGGWMTDGFAKTAAGGSFNDGGWGTETRFLNGDEMKDLDACSLSLQPCVDPVVTPSGVLYDKRVVLEYIIARKKDIERQMAEWQAQQSSNEAEAAAAAADAQEAQISEFVAQQEGLSQADIRARASSSQSSGASASTMGRALLADRGKHAADTSFWAPQNTPVAKTVLEKPDGVVRCPITQEPLRLKQLVPVKFTLAEAGTSADALAGMASKERYICPLSKKALTNIHPASVLRPSGMVIATACIKARRTAARARTACNLVPRPPPPPLRAAPSGARA